MSVTEKFLQIISKLESIYGEEIVIMGNKQALQHLPIDASMCYPDNDTYPIIWHGYKCIVSDWHGYKCITLGNNPNLKDDCIYLMPISYKPLKIGINSCGNLC